MLVSAYFIRQQITVNMLKGKMYIKLCPTIKSVCNSYIITFIIMLLLEFF